MFRRKRKTSEFSAEIEAHLELETARWREQGLSEEEAQAAARRAFGNVTQAQERFYESGRRLWCRVSFLNAQKAMLGKAPSEATRSQSE